MWRDRCAKQLSSCDSKSLCTDIVVVLRLGIQQQKISALTAVIASVKLETLL